MKKALIVFSAIALSCLNVDAQTKGFESNIKVRFDACIDGAKNHDFGAEYIAGYRFSPKAKLGVGTGISWVNQLYEEYSVIYKGKHDYYETAAFVPLFLNGKFNFLSGGVSPYFNLNAGYTAFIPFSDYAKYNHLSAFVNPSFGIDIPLSKGAVTMELGYKYQVRKVDANALCNMGSCNYSTFEVALGYQF